VKTNEIVVRMKLNTKEWKFLEFLAPRLLSNRTDARMQYDRLLA